MRLRVGGRRDVEEIFPTHTHIHTHTQVRFSSLFNFLIYRDRKRDAGKSDRRDGQRDPVVLCDDSITN